jgi:hypothetical protein
MTKKLLTLALLAAAAACDGGSEEVAPEVEQARRAAARSACVGAELARHAEDQLQTLEASFPSGEGPAADITRQASRAALEYARAYDQHARLRVAAYAQADSALNHSPRRADSLRHVQRAQQFQVRLPEVGTLEGNVLQAYQRDFAARISDPDHPCNWELEEPQAAGNRQ